MRILHETGNRPVTVHPGSCAAFALVETWSSAEAHKAHLNRLLLSGAWGQIVSHLAKEPASGIFSAI